MAHWLKQLACFAAMGMIAACSQSGAEAQQTTGAAEVAPIESNWTIDKLASSISFTGSMNGDDFTGSFDDFEAQIQFDVDALEDANIYVSVDMASADAGDEERNEALPGKEWFFVKSFPNAIFKSSSVSKTGADSFEAVGELTLKDVTRSISLPFSLTIEDGKANAKARISLDRSVFGVGTGMWKSEDWVAHKVDLQIDVQALKRAK